MIELFMNKNGNQKKVSQFYQINFSQIELYFQKMRNKFKTKQKTNSMLSLEKLCLPM